MVSTRFVLAITVSVSPQFPDAVICHTTMELVDWCKHVRDEQIQGHISSTASSSTENLLSNLLTYIM